jgi:lipopolysaccharide transport system permease protein
MRGEPFVVVDAVVDVVANVPAVRVLSHEICTLRRLRWRSFRRGLPKLFTVPVASLWRNRMLLRSMVKRDILTRYRGSMGDVLWTVLNPLLLMLTYFFVFGVVLRTRFGADATGSGYVLYFLAGMLPWLAFSEAAGRAPYIILEHRNWVKKLVFPLEILPAIPVISGIVTEVFAVIIFVTALFALRGHVPLTAAWLPALVIPQILFTVGLAWFLAALAVYMRDLGQINGFLLTLWFFLTPICYPVAAMPKGALKLLGKNPLFVLVQAYRDVLLDGHSPAALPLLKLWILALIVFFAGHAWFYKLRKTFADII